MLDHFQAAEHIALGIGDGLTLFGAQGDGDAAHVLANECLQLQHDAGTGGERSVLPGLVGGFGGGNGCLDFRVRGEWHLGQHFLGGGVNDVVPFLGLRFDELAVHEKFDGGGPVRSALRVG